MQAVVKRAKAGDPKAISQAADNYYLGQDGFPQNFKSAYFWAQRAHALQVGRATYYIAIMLLEGKGIAQRKSDGIMYLTLAATQSFGICLGGRQLWAEAKQTGSHLLAPNRRRSRRSIRSGSTQTGRNSKQQQVAATVIAV